jgi:ribosomal-protein-alanine N-acetyltransferase
MDNLAPLDLSRFFEVHPILETERLILRPITLADADDVYEYGRDPKVGKYMIYPLHTSIADAINWLETVPGEFARRERINFAITLKPNGKFVGSCSYHHISPEHHRLQIGYVLTRSAWGKGYMAETVSEMIRFAFEEMSMHRIEATCYEANERSARVMERCGMKHEGTLKHSELRFGKFVTQKVYAIIRD